ncbi:MAG: Dabb family protein [Faecalibacterium sp.]|nr:Dabb family protein [Ruminococcus sp.]MCM1391402.1 Dabb family protein [Ruminococcus sp.]MCM1486627.1 Dabb family protein [Faecalibacterium sp.]
MIKHVVMWKFKPFAEGKTKEENLLYVKSMLEALPEKIDFIRSMEVNLNVNPKETMFDAVLISTFDTLDDVAAYRVHPDHKVISSYVALVREARASVDYEMDV